MRINNNYLKMDNIRSIKVALAIAAAMTGATPAIAQEGNFDTIVQTIMAGDSRTKATIATSRSELETLKADNTLPDPEVEFSYVWGRHNIGNKLAAGISQSFEWPGAYAARSKANQLTEQAIDHYQAMLNSDRKAEISTALINLIATRKKIALLTQLRQNVDTLLTLTERGFERGETTRLDINKLRIEHIGISRQLTELQAEQESALSDLSSYSNGLDCRQLTSTLDNYPTLTLQPLDTYLTSLTQGDRGSYLTLSAQSAKMREKAARRSTLPGFSLGYEYELEMGDQFHGLTAGISIPLFRSSKAIKAARLSTIAADLNAQADLNEEQAAITRDYQTALLLREDLTAYGPVLSNTDHITLLRKAYNGGQLTLLEFLQEANYFTDAHLTYLTLEHQYHLLLATLTRHLPH